MSLGNKNDQRSITPSPPLPLFHSHIVAMEGIEKARSGTESSILLESTELQSNLFSKISDEDNEKITAVHKVSNLDQNLEPMSQCMPPNGVSNFEVSLFNKPDTNDTLTVIPHSLVDSVINYKQNDSCEDSKDEVFVKTIKGTNVEEASEYGENLRLLHDPSSNDNAACLLKENTPCASLENKLEKCSTWRKLDDGDGSYYWNVDTGATQYETPSEVKQLLSDNEQFDSLDSSLADLEGAAFRYASLHISDDNSTDRDAQSSDWTVGSDVGRMFSVQSLGWLPLDHFSSDPETSSSEVNACIKHLSSSHSKITDGVGAWGEGKEMMLLIEDENLKLLDPLSKAVLQNQSIKHIRVWGVGGNSPHDFAYVAKDNQTRQYKCHVFRCDASAKAIAQELHNVCEKLSFKSNKESNKDELEKQQIAMSTSMPIAKSEPNVKFEVKYLGAQKVDNVNGIQTIKNVIREVTTNDQALCIESVALISASAVVINGSSDGHEIVNCRTRCLSFMGIGDDISLFAFINVVGTEAKCHVVQCLPNAAKLAHAVQEACMIRFQKAVDSRCVPDANPSTTSNKKSFKRYFKNIFQRKSHS